MKIAVDTVGSESIANINVVPLVDIMLVLLLIFMVTAKIMVAPALPMDLPQAASSEEVQVVFSVILAADGALLVDGRAVSDHDMLLARAKAALENHPDIRAVINADGGVPHRRVVAVMDVLKSAGIGRLAFGVSPLEPGAG